MGDEPAGKAAVVWMVGEYGAEVAEAPDRVRCWEQAEPARKLANLQDIPVLVVEAEA